MSTISVGGLSQFYQSVSVSQPQATQATDASATSDAAAPDGAQQVQHGHHHRGGGHGELFKKIESAVTSALQSAQADGSSDPNQVIQSAIEKVFQDNGVAPPATEATGPTAAAQPHDPNGDGDVDAPGKADNDGPSSARQAFVQTLQSFGVDPQQFHQDFLTAIQNARGGNADTSDAFKSFPPGSNVDTTG